MGESTRARISSALEHLEVLGEAQPVGRDDEVGPGPDLRLGCGRDRGLRRRGTTRRPRAPRRTRRSPARSPRPRRQSRGRGCHRTRATRCGRSFQKLFTNPPLRPLGPPPQMSCSSTTTSTPGSSRFSWIRGPQPRVAAARGSRRRPSCRPCSTGASSPANSGRASASRSHQLRPRRAGTGSSRRHALEFRVRLLDQAELVPSDRPSREMPAYRSAFQRSPPIPELGPMSESPRPSAPQDPRCRMVRPGRRGPVATVRSHPSAEEAVTMAGNARAAAERSPRAPSAPLPARCCAPLDSARKTSASPRSPWPRAGTRSLPATTTSTSSPRSPRKACVRATRCRSSSRRSRSPTASRWATRA